MEATKKLNGKAVGKWLSNNAIIMMMLAVTLIVGIIHPNFFSGTNMINLFKNVSIRYIIALGISGCLITTGNDLSEAVWLVSLPAWPASLRRPRALPVSSTPTCPLCPPLWCSFWSLPSAPSWVCATVWWSAT